MKKLKEEQNERERERERDRGRSCGEEYSCWGHICKTNGIHTLWIFEQGISSVSRGSAHLHIRTFNFTSLLRLCKAAFSVIHRRLWCYTLAIHIGLTQKPTFCSPVEKKREKKKIHTLLLVSKEKKNNSSSEKKKRRERKKI